MYHSHFKGTGASVTAVQLNSLQSNMAACPLIQSSLVVPSQGLACKASIVHYQRDIRVLQENQPTYKLIQACLYIINLLCLKKDEIENIYSLSC